MYRSRMGIGMVMALLAASPGILRIADDQVNGRTGGRPRTRTMRKPHDQPPNPNVSRQVRRAMERAAKKATRP